MRTLLLSIGLMLASALPAAETRTAAPGASPPAATVAAFDWMVGTWEGDGLGGKVLESWSAPAAGQMPGHFRSLKGDGTPSFYEFMMIADVDGSIEFRVKHFNPDMTGWEEKADFIRFPLVAVEKDAWFFDGLTIRRTGADSVVHFVRVRNRQDGSTREIRFDYRRIAR